MTRLTELIVAGMWLGVASSPWVAGTLIRATLSVGFAWTKIITHDQFMWFAQHCHW